MSRAYQQQSNKEGAVHNLLKTRIGYTDHNAGMYADRFMHKNLQCENGRYNWKGNVYRDPDRGLPGRWKNKQFSVAKPEWYPGGRTTEGKNLYGLNGARLKDLRDGDKFPSVSAPFRAITATKTGFGITLGKTKFVPDISTNMRAARWTHALKKEKRNGPLPPSEAELEEMIMQTTSDSHMIDYNDEEDDIENEDPWVAFRPGSIPNESRRRIQRHKAGHKGGHKPRIYGPTRPSSATVGEGAWALDLNGATINAHHKVNHTKYFKNKGHLCVQNSENRGMVPEAAFNPPGAMTYRQPSK